MTKPTPQAKTAKPVENQSQAQNKQGIAEAPTSTLTGSMAGQIQRDPRSLSPNSILQLQRTIGNQAVSSMLGVNQITPRQNGNVTIQRKFGGEMASKSDNDIAQLLREDGYIVNNITLPKISNLRQTQDTYSDVTGIANALGLRRKSQTTSDSTPKIPPKDTPKDTTTSGTTPFGTGLRPMGLRNVGTKTTGTGVKDTGTSSIDTSRPGISGLRSTKTGSTGTPIGGGTTWAQGSRSVRVDASAKGGEPPQPFGQLTLEYSFTKAGLEFKADVFSNPKLMWDQGDLVTITLQFKNETSELIGDLRVQKTGNIVQLLGKVSFGALASMLSLPPVTGTVEEKRDKLATKSVQMGILAMWRNKEDKGEQHRSGGIDQKGGSGLINVSATPINEATLKKTEDEGIRNTGWNENEIATESRPLVKSFPNLIKLGEEIATTLEAESEYMVEKSGYEQILSAMETISGKGKEELLTSFGIQKEVSPSVKNYVDTYYDLDLSTEGSTDTSLPLLDNNIVFRKRSVPKELNNGEGDPEDTNLIAIKGRSVTEEGEAIRLASQFQAKYDLLSPEKQEEVLRFLRSEQVDNPFARTLQHALGDNVGVLDRATKLKKSLTVKSKRTKYKLWLANSTMIDLSVDEAHGEMDGYPVRKEDVVYSFEFGVGHPGLSTGATGSGGLSEEDPKLMKLEKELSEITQTESLAKNSKMTSIKNRKEVTNQLVHRPYHVPKDLKNKNLFAKGDYVQYKNLRDTVIDRLFRMEKTALERGGNKARVLAQKIKTGL